MISWLISGENVWIRSFYSTRLQSLRVKKNTRNVLTYDVKKDSLRSLFWHHTWIVISCCMVATLGGLQDWCISRAVTSIVYELPNNLSITRIIASKFTNKSDWMINCALQIGGLPQKITSSGLFFFIIITCASNRIVRWMFHFGNACDVWVVRSG